MTNPNNAVGTNGAFGGRTSVNAFNDDLASYTAGILSGWACEPDSGLTVVLGGDGNTRDVAIAEDNAGNKTTINNISGSPISVTVGSAPNTNSRIDSIVAYVDNPPTGSATVTDNYEACGLIVVAGTASATPTAPNESTIRTAITADGASGTTAYFVVLATITIESGTTDLTNVNIHLGEKAKLNYQNNNNATFSTSEQAIGTWIDGRTIYRRVVDSGILTGSSNIVYDAFNGAAEIISTNGYWINGSNNQLSSFNGTFVTSGPIAQSTRALLYPSDNGRVTLQFTQLSGTVPSSVRFIVTVEYTKTN